MNTQNRHHSKQSTPPFRSKLYRSAYTTSLSQSWRDTHSNGLFCTEQSSWDETNNGGKVWKKEHMHSPPVGYSPEWMVMERSLYSSLSAPTCACPPWQYRPMSSNWGGEGGACVRFKFSREKRESTHHWKCELFANFRSDVLPISCFERISIYIDR